MKQQIEQAIKLLQEAIKEQSLELEDHNFRVNSDGWTKITIDNISYLKNPEKDIWEILTGECIGEQLFTWDAAMRETAKANKRMPTDEEFSELLKVRKDMPNIVLAGYRNTSGTFNGRGALAYFWSSAESGALAWYRYLFSTAATVSRLTVDKAYGFSVRCLSGYKISRKYFSIPAVNKRLSNSIWHFWQKPR